MAYQIWAFTQAGAKAAVLDKAFGISLTKEANATGNNNKFNVGDPIII
jgi:hypothetical protein